MYHKVLLPVDLNEEASWKKALPTAITLCQTFGASLHVVTVLPEFKMPMVGAYFPKNFSGVGRRRILLRRLLRARRRAGA